MSWPQVAGPHVGHRLTLKDAWNLRCIDCAMTLVIHRESGAPTATPPRWRRPDVPLASPEVVALRKREAMAAIEHARQRRTEAEICGLCGVREARRGHTACSRCA